MMRCSNHGVHLHISLMQIRFGTSVELILLQTKLLLHGRNVNINRDALS